MDERPDDPLINPVMTGFYTFSLTVFHAYHLVQSFNRDEYEIGGAIDLLIQSGQTIDAISLDGWRIDVGYPEYRDEAEYRFCGDDTDAEGDDDTEAVVEPNGEGVNNGQYRDAGQRSITPSGSVRPRMPPNRF